MTPLRLSDTQLRQILDVAAVVPHDLRSAFLEAVATELRGRDLGDGTVHRIAHETARAIVRTARRTAWG
jgi:hypothetical protein